MNSIREMGAGEPAILKRVALGEMAAIPIETFNCPSRRAAEIYPYVHGSPFHNCTYPKGAGRTDYASNYGGNTPYNQDGPSTLAAGDTAPETYWEARNGNGVSYQRSEVTIADITDGTSQTYMLGERYINPDEYKTGTAADDDQNLYMGHDWDVVRSGHPAHRPMQDRNGYNSAWSFGSAHPAGFNMAFCDGSVRVINYEIWNIVQGRLAARNDGNVVSPDEME